MRVIGTAGHVDHGKSTLVEAMTGTHPDRLKEEREREMTIDLGFAWMTLPNSGEEEPEEIGVVDVPGHRDFIENMLAGIGGIDAVLFVVAADEGVMPQTREHLAILDILQVPRGVVALTKIDLVDDLDWLDLVEEDLHDIFRDTVLEDAPIVRVSARKRQGIPELLAALSACLADTPPRPDTGRPRLPIDRVFTIAGFGTVVTGTLSDGHLRTGEAVEILPRSLQGRIRGLQTHKRKEDLAVPGGRTAVNVSGVTLDELQRGDVLAHPGDYRPTRRLDVSFRLLPDASSSIKHNTEVKLFIGAAELVARLRLLGSDELLPGTSGWLQLETAEPVVAVRGDRYILRRPSPGETLGGGVVIDPHPKGRHKRFAREVIERLDALAKGTPAEVVFQAVIALGAASQKDILARSTLEHDAAQRAIQELIGTGQVIELEENGQLLTSQGFWEQLADRAVLEVANYHRKTPLRLGMPKEELKSRLKTQLKASPRLFNAMMNRLISGSVLEEAGPLVLVPGHRVQFSAQQQRLIDQLIDRFRREPYAPPSTKESQAEVGDEVFSALLDLGYLVSVAPEVVFRTEDYNRMAADIRKMINERGSITAAEVRDHFNTSRKYVLALLEHLDAIGVTVRKGDVRIIRK
jgi:selenocysteine-specific elongation factor